MNIGAILKLFVTFSFFLPYVLLLRPLISFFEEEHKKGPTWRRAITYIPLFVVGWPIEKCTSLMMDQKLL